MSRPPELEKKYKVEGSNRVAPKTLYHPDSPPTRPNKENWTTRTRVQRRLWIDEHPNQFGVRDGWVMWTPVTPDRKYGAPELVPTEM